MKSSKTVFVGLSGGVDSAVAALRLKNQGYNVVGVFIKVWQPDFIDCNWEAERLDAMRVAAHLEIPFLMCDAETAYKQEVADYFIAEYKAGRTPNPDVMCNKAVKFGAFYRYALASGADFVATGHYAQIINPSTQPSSRFHLEHHTPGSRFHLELQRGVDTDKDQSYFLWMINKTQLPQILLPIGQSTKAVVREEAVAAAIPVAIKKDSQGICFLGHIDIPEFLSHYIELLPGDVLNEQGKAIGLHQGAQVYTVGQRHGFTITEPQVDRPVYFVVERDLTANTITVSDTKPIVNISETLLLTSLNLLTETLSIQQKITVQTRYRQTPVAATIISLTNETMEISLDDTHERPAAGQSCVLYDAEVCLGGGIIN